MYLLVHVFFTKMFPSAYALWIWLSDLYVS